jgi:hypothetical protein
MYDPVAPNSLPTVFRELNTLKETNEEIATLFQTKVMQQLKFRPADKLYYPVLSGVTDSSTDKDALLYELKDLIDNFQVSDPELNSKIYNFLSDLAIGTIFNMGFRIKLNTIQPFISYKYYTTLVQNAIDSFKEEVMSNDNYFDNYFNSFLTLYDPELKDEDGKPTPKPSKDEQYFKNYQAIMNTPDILQSRIKALETRNIELSSQVAEMKDPGIEKPEGQSECGGTI